MEQKNVQGNSPRVTQKSILYVIIIYSVGGPPTCWTFCVKKEEFRWHKIFFLAQHR